MAPKTAVILSTYNRPEFLELSLTGLLVQTDTEFDIVIADDGSGPDTKELIERFQNESSLPINHVWQEDKGFRKAKILNEAVHSTDAGLLVFLDQDAIPGRDWMALHRAIYAPNRFVPGGYIRLTKEDSEKLDVEKIRQGAYEALMTEERLRFLKRRHWKSLFYFLTMKKIRPRLMGLNFSVARDLFEKVNGYDEAYEGWGKEDSDLRTRMRQSGAPPETAR